MSDTENTSGVQVLTFGCRLNAYESEVMRRHAEGAGLGPTVIVNTCSVTNEAVRQARQAIRRAGREHPDARIVVTGCAAQTETAMFAAMPEVAQVVGNAEKLEAATWRPDASADAFGFERVRVNDIGEARETAAHLIDGLSDRTRAFVQVQNGCDHRCTFCIIPYGRGPSRSVPMGAVVGQVRRLVDTGHREVVLTGVDVTSYGHDLPGAPSLGRLVQAILAGVPDLARLRLSSIDSVEIDEALMDAIASEPRLMPHLHLSLQHGADLILKRMKRRHSRADAIRFVDEALARRPDLVFGADLIAGFPTETETHLADLLSIVEEARITHLHAFPFSPREGTPAARMPQLPRALVKERAARLREAGARGLARHLDALRGSRQNVLVERPGFGRAEGYTGVRLAPEHPVGEIVSVRIGGHDGAQAIEAGLREDGQLDGQLGGTESLAA